MKQPQYGAQANPFNQQHVVVRHISYSVDLLLVLTLFDVLNCYQYCLQEVCERKLSSIHWPSNDYNYMSVHLSLAKIDLS